MSRLERTRSLATLLVASMLLVLGDPGSTYCRTDEPTATSSDAETKKELFGGQVVRLTDALEEKDIRASEEMEAHFVLKTAKGELIPILADWRGRAFYQDQRLRNRDVELVGFRRPGIPYLQVLMIFTFDEDGQRQYTDYWCDVCSIPMYEIKPCECCQGEIRIRYQPQELPEYLAQPESEESDVP